jgi:predicted kinase
MKTNLLIIISGPPCTGKTTLAKRIAKEFCLPLISRDDIKEVLFDSLGIKDREWSRKLGTASFGIIYQIINSLLSANISFIVETPLKPEYDEKRFLNLKKKFGFKTLQIACKTDGKILYDRFKKRSESGQRHPGHCDNKNYDEFRETLLDGEYPPLGIGGEILEVNTTDFSSIDYDRIFHRISQQLKSGQMP